VRRNKVKNQIAKIVFDRVVGCHQCGGSDRKLIEDLASFFEEYREANKRNNI
jgi:hypothetical protein